MVSYCDPVHLSFLTASDANCPNSTAKICSTCLCRNINAQHELLFMNNNIGAINDINTQVSWVHSLVCVVALGHGVDGPFFYYYMYMYTITTVNQFTLVQGA